MDNISSSEELNSFSRDCEQQRFDYFISRCGQRIKEERKKAGLSQDELGYKIGTSRQTISKWERGESLPEVSDMLKMRVVFNCDFGYLVGDYFCRHQPETDIHERTGLSEDAIKNLEILTAKRWSNGLAFINGLLVNPYFLKAIEYVEKYIYILSQQEFRDEITSFFEESSIYRDVEQWMDYAISKKSNLSFAKLSLNDAIQLYKLSIQDNLQDATRDALKGLANNGSDNKTKK